MPRKIISSLLILLFVFQSVTVGIAQSQRQERRPTSLLNQYEAAQIGVIYVRIFINEDGSGFCEVGRVGVRYLPPSCVFDLSEGAKDGLSGNGIQTEGYAYTTKDSCFSGVRSHFRDVASLSAAFNRLPAQAKSSGGIPLITKAGNSITIKLPPFDASAIYALLGEKFPIPLVYSVSLPEIDTPFVGSCLRGLSNVTWVTNSLDHTKEVGVSGKLGQYLYEDDGPDIGEVAEAIVTANTQDAAKVAQVIKVFGEVYEAVNLYRLIRNGAKFIRVPVVRLATTRLPRLVATAPKVLPVPIKSVWELPWVIRGLEIEKMLGGNLPAGFNIIDKFDRQTGVATSIKSLNLRAASYQSEKALTNKIVSYLNKVEGFQGGRSGVVDIKEGEISRRVLELALPSGSMTEIQQVALMNAQKHADDLGVQLIVRTIP